MLRVSLFDRATDNQPKHADVSWEDLAHEQIAAELARDGGSETPAREAELKKLYSRDLTNTGTCPVCRANVKRLTDGGMVHHGYQRPGDGYIHGDCFGVAFQPWELSPVGASEYVVAVLKPFLARSEAYLARLESGDVKSFLDSKQVFDGGRYVTKTTEVTAESNAWRFRDMMESALYRTKRDVKNVTADIATFEADIAAWKQDVLPEVKYAASLRG